MCLPLGFSASYVFHLEKRLGAVLCGVHALLSNEKLFSYRPMFYRAALFLQL